MCIIYIKKNKCEGHNYEYSQNQVNPNEKSIFGFFAWLAVL
ncbi:hypothetical protein L289_0475 [Acinetobacter gerneri DSM 14967 = CIP 107464 = MTCC 9824]|nr:hypothetical protein L289_0475 [Acinetobacter gerneri DSM 14967 = CIP 107464 = MTCC 9824]